MADPLSGIAGVVGLLDVATRTSSQVWKLIEAWRSAPTQILDLSEEIHTSRRVISQLQTACDTVTDVTEFDPFIEVFTTQIDIARTVCMGLESILQSISGTSLDSRRRIRKERWLQARSKVADLQSQLGRVRSNIMLILCIQSALRGAQLDLLLRTQHEAVMDVLRPRATPTSNATIPTSTSTIFEGCEESLDLNAANRELEAFQPGSRVISLATPRRVVCKSSCKCSCHFYRSYSRFYLAGFNNIIGSVTVAYSTPTGNISTHEASCLRAKFSSLELSYSFPSWLLNLSILTVLSMSNGTPNVGLIVRRRISRDSAIAFRTLYGLVMNGDYLGVKASLETREGRAQLHDVLSSDGASALHSAAHYGNVAIVKLLLAAGADIFLEDDFGRPPTTTAAKWILNQSAFPAIVVLGLRPTCLRDELAKEVYRVQINATDDFGADPNRRNVSTNATPLMEACRIDSLACVKALLAAGANVNTGDERPIYLASAFASVPVVELLVSEGADVNDFSNICRSGPLAHAAKHNQLEITDFLLSKGADIDHRDWEGDTALTEAIIRGAVLCIDLLLSRNANYTFVDKYNFTILHNVAASGDARVANLLASAVLKGLDLDARNKKGKTARQILESRAGVTDELLEAFNKLIDSVSRNKTHQEDTMAGSKDASGRFSGSHQELVHKLTHHVRLYVPAIWKYRTSILLVFLLLISHLAQTMIECISRPRASALPM
ncbi:ankyrin [Mytilinidion resinicola]|uniref:Ankyrin n=1 Tax=Mytilinidion resinicola TaxID=574789 RepID=A0A6A6YBL7_9PEZI|nr:ankyrin [Mytilinidion resinicola]KAF2805404.1 ankyrin [Mytilinidion resinicola]